MPFGKTVFLKELVKDGEQFIAAGGKAGFSAAILNGTNGINPSTGKKRKYSETLILKYSTKPVQDLPPPNISIKSVKGKKLSKRSSASAATSEIYSKIPLQLIDSADCGPVIPRNDEKVKGKDKAILKIFENIKYPIDDKVYWNMVLQMGGFKTAPPVPNSTLFGGTLSSAPHLIGRLLGVWAVISNFRSVLSLPAVTLEALEYALEVSTFVHSEVDPGPVRTHDKIGVHPLLREIHISMLSLLCLDKEKEKERDREKEKEKEKEQIGSIPSRIRTLSVCGAYKETEDSLISTLVTLDRENVHDKDVENVRTALRTGDSWVESMRIQIATRCVCISTHPDKEKEKNCIVLPDYRDELGEIEQMILTVSSDLDPTDIKTGELEKLDVILLRIRSGYYDTHPTHADTECSTYVHTSSSEGSLKNDKTDMRTKRLTDTTVDNNYDDESNIQNGSVRDVAEDVREILSNMHTHEEEISELEVTGVRTRSRSDSTVRTTALSDFNFLYAKRIEASRMEKLKFVDKIFLKNIPNEKRTSSDILPDAKWMKLREKADMQNLCHLIGTTEYHTISVESKLNLLEWLCYEVVSTTTVHTFLVDIHEKRKKLEKSEQLKLKIPNASLEIDANSEILNENQNNKKRKSNIINSDVANNSSISSGRERRSTKSQVNTVTAALNPEDVDSGPESAADSIENYSYVGMQLEPLGKDREERIYWVLSSGVPTLSGTKSVPRVFVEDQRYNREEWAVYSTQEDLNALLSWLCEKGVYEAKLKISLIQWMDSNDVHVNCDTVEALIERYATEKGKKKSKKSEKKVKNEGDADNAGNQENMDNVEDRIVSDSDASPGGSARSDTEYDADWERVCAEMHEIKIRMNDEDSDDDVLDGFNYDSNKYENQNDGSVVSPTGYLQHSLLQKDLEPIGVCVNVELEYGVLGMGVKALDTFGVIVVSSFKYTEDGFCAAKRAGVRIGDQILVVGNHVINSVGSLQAAMKDILSAPTHTLPHTQESTQVNTQSPTQKSLHTAVKSDANQNHGNQNHGNKKHANMLLLRWPDPKVLPGFSAALKKDPEMLNCFSVQELEDWGTYVHPVREDGIIPGRLCGAVLHLLKRLSHPYAVGGDTSSDSEGYPYNIWSISVHNCVQLLRIASTSCDSLQYDDALRSLLATLSAAVSHVEDLVARKGCVGKPSWKIGRKRFRWRKNCQEVRTCSQMAYVAAILSDSIDWSDFTQAVIPMSRKTYLLTLPEEERENALGNIPEEGSQILYYPEGSLTALKADSAAGLTPMWGGLKPVCGDAVVSCTVSAVRFYRCGISPFVQVDLAVCKAAKSGLKPPPVLQPSRHPHAFLNRMIAKMAKTLILFSDNEFEAFTIPVCKNDFPEYYKQIKRPMDLGKINQKAFERKYSSIDIVVEELELIRNNCRTFCSATFPELVEAADNLLEEATILLRKYGLLPKRACGEDINRLNGVPSISAKEKKLVEGDGGSIREVNNTNNKNEIVVIGEDMEVMMAEDEESKKNKDNEENKENQLIENKNASTKEKGKIGGNLKENITVADEMEREVDDAEEGSTSRDTLLSRTSQNTINNTSSVVNSDTAHCDVVAVNSTTNSSTGISGSSNYSGTSINATNKKNFTVCVRLGGQYVDFLVSTKGTYSKCCSGRTSYHLEDMCTMSLLAADQSVVTYKVPYLPPFRNLRFVSPLNFFYNFIKVNFFILLSSSFFFFRA